MQQSLCRHMLRAGSSSSSSSGTLIKQTMNRTVEVENPCWTKSNSYDSERRKKIQSPDEGNEGIIPPKGVIQTGDSKSCKSGCEYYMARHMWART